MLRKKAGTFSRQYGDPDAEIAFHHLGFNRRRHGEAIDLAAQQHLPPTVPVAREPAAGQDDLRIYKEPRAHHRVAESLNYYRPIITFARS